MTAEAGKERALSTVFDGLWRVFSDSRTALALGAVTLLGAVLALRAGRLDTLVMRGMLALLAFSLLLQLAIQIERAVRVWSSRFTPAPWEPPAVELVPKGATEAVYARAEVVWRESFSHVLSAEPPDAALYGARRRPGIVGPILAVSGALIVLAGLWLNTLRGWSAGDLVLGGGVGVSLPGGAQLVLEEAAPGATGAAIRLSQSGREEARVAATGRPARSGAFWVQARAGGPTLEATAHDAAGNAVTLLPMGSGRDAGPALSIPFPPTQAEQAFSAPESALVFRTVSYPSLPERGIAGPVFLVEAFRVGDEEPAMSQLVEDEAAMLLDGMTFSLRRGAYLDVKAAYLPGWPLLAAGALLVALGLLLAALFGAREAWLTLPAGGVAVVQAQGGLRSRHDALVLADAVQAGSDAG